MCTYFYQYDLIKTFPFHICNVKYSQHQKCTLNNNNIKNKFISAHKFWFQLSGTYTPVYIPVNCDYNFNFGYNYLPDLNIYTGVYLYTHGQKQIYYYS